MPTMPFRQVHLDFHTSEQIPGVGSRFDGERFAETLKRAHVNSITCFSRCHHGMIYHDTRFADARHPHLTCNLLAEQIAACHAVGIRVPIYITVGWDELQSRRHPEWLQRTAEGKPYGAAPLEAGWHKLCFNSPYVDFVWAQTEEVLETFDVDGLFFDIVWQRPCYCSYCLEGMVAAGLDPQREADVSRFARAVEERFKRRFTEGVRARNDDCTIFYNAGHVGPDIRATLATYSHLELESLPSGGWGYMHFPLTQRFARTLGVPALGMTGKFHKSWGDFSSLKDEAALQYECFTMLAEGAQCSIGDQLHPAGELDAATYALVGGVYAQVEAKEPWCAGAESVAEIAILTPEAIGQNDARVDSAAAGALRMLQEAHLPCDVVDNESDWTRYALLFMPDKLRLDATLRNKTRAFLAGGGGLILSHASGLAADGDQFALEEFGVEARGPAEYAPDFIAPREALAEGVPATQHVLYERGLNLAPRDGAEVLADLWHPYFERSWRHFCSHSHTPLAAPSQWPGAVQYGRVITFAHPLFGMYTRHGARVYRQLALNAIARLLPQPLLRTNAPTTARVTLLCQPSENRRIIHVLHYLPQRRHTGFDTLEDIIPLANVTIAVRGNPPRAAYLAPSRQPLQTSTADGYTQTTIPEVRGHQMIVFED
jgi:Hypothetical glycosyl hydrolase 6/Beta-galactosidase trimerisation domain